MSQDNIISHTLLIVILLIVVLVFGGLAIFALYWSWQLNDETVYNNTKFRTIKRFHDHNKALDKLFELDNITKTLIARINNKVRSSSYSSGNIVLEEIAYNLNLNLHHITMQEVDPTWTTGHRAFTKNKRDISICLRKKDGTFYDKNLIKFVFIHELAHIGTDPRYTEAHSPEFWRTFKILLVEADKAGLLRVINYGEKKNNTEYCSIKVDYNPYFDDSISLKGF